MSSFRQALSSRKALNGGLCVLGASGAFAGMFLESHLLFLVGIGVGVLGYLGIRRALKGALEREGGQDGPER